MPLHDWQFWVVTVLVSLAVYALARTFLPRRRAESTGDASCPTCPSGGARSRKRGRRVALTIDRKRI